MPGDVSFGRYRFEPLSGRLWSGKREIRLTPRAGAVLAALVKRAGQPVTRDELFTAVWGDTVVGDDALTSCIQELRQALADEAKQPRFIETRHRRGYRFVASLSSSPTGEAAGHGPPRRVALKPPPVVVGREREQSELNASLARATHGERQIVFVTGEPGIGKTTVVEAFLSAATCAESLWIGQGRCIEHYGAGEAYLPLLEALTRLCREPGGEHLLRLLRKHAPTWLGQMPSFLSSAEMKALQHQTAGVTRERMLRELAEALEVATADRPLVLWLEDLHWTDVSTLDWLAYMGRRPEPARLLLLGVYRSVEALTRGHPLKAVKDELEVHGHCRELALSLLDQAAIREYLVRRFPPVQPNTAALGEIASAIFRRTDGNPLFVVNVVADLLSRGVLVQHDGRWEVTQTLDVVQRAMPDDIRGIITRQLDRVRPDEWRILEAASAAGAEFSSAAVAAAAEVALDEADACCAELARRELFLTVRGEDEWPDGTLSGRYGFRHALYQEVVHEHVPAGRRVELHRRIGARIEAAFGDRAGEVATELAMHFRRGRDDGRAIRYLHRAGENATLRGAPREAVGHLTEALDLLRTLPASPARARQEVALQLALGTPLMAIKGSGSPEVERAYVRAQELCESMSDRPELFQVLWGLWRVRTSRAELDLARALGGRLLTLARNTDDSGVTLEAHHALWTPLFLQGELVAARDHIVEGIALYDSDRHASLASVYGHHDPGVCGLSMGAWTLELLGESEQADRHIQDARALARRLGHPFSETQVLLVAAFVQRLRGNWMVTGQLAAEAGAMARERGFVELLARATTLQGWAMAHAGQIEDGIGQMSDGVAAVRALGPVDLPYFLGALADGHAKAGRADAALEVLTEALAAAERTGERFYEAELLRVRGELLVVARREDSGAEQCFRTALDISRRQRALALERRAFGSLRELLNRQGREAEASAAGS
jgi:DNA-binding winged helix-turn-helix (wHTH) protein/predicted ATPase